MSSRNGIANLTRAHDDALIAKVTAPTPPMSSRNPLEGHDVALYVDGRRVSITYLDIASIADGALSILFETALAAALNPAVDATMSMAWGGFTPQQVVNYRVAPSEPSGGVFQILSVRLPTEPNGNAYFVGTALTALYDWSDEGHQIAVAGDECEILTTHVERQ